MLQKTTRGHEEPACPPPRWFRDYFQRVQFRHVLFFLFFLKIWDQCLRPHGRENSFTKGVALNGQAFVVADHLAPPDRNWVQGGGVRLPIQRFESRDGQSGVHSRRRVYHGLAPFEPLLSIPYRPARV